MPSAWGCLLSRTALRFRAISDARSPPPWICPWHDRYLAPGAVRRDQGAAGGLELGLLSQQLFSWHPLYRRGLQVWGSAMVAFNVVALLAGQVPTEEAATLYGWMSVIGLGLCVFFGMRANQMAIERYQSLGWEFAGPRRKLL